MQAPTKPVQRPRERALAYYNRVNEWERTMRLLMPRLNAEIDATMTRVAAIRQEHATTRQVARDRLTLHDHAQFNPVLHKILRKHPELA